MFKLKNEAILRGPCGRYRLDNPSKVCLLLEMWNAMDTAVAIVMNSTSNNHHRDGQGYTTKNKSSNI